MFQKDSGIENFMDEREGKEALSRFFVGKVLPHSMENVHGETFLCLKKFLF